jgi:hypothetical protein
VVKLYTGVVKEISLNFLHHMMSRFPKLKDTGSRFQKLVNPTPLSGHMDVVEMDSAMRATLECLDLGWETNTSVQVHELGQIIPQRGMMLEKLSLSVPLAGLADAFVLMGSSLKTLTIFADGYFTQDNAIPHLHLPCLTSLTIVHLCNDTLHYAALISVIRAAPLLECLTIQYRGTWSGRCQLGPELASAIQFLVHLCTLRIGNACVPADFIAKSCGSCESAACLCSIFPRIRWLP